MTDTSFFYSDEDDQDILFKQIKERSEKLFIADGLFEIPPEVNPSIEVIISSIATEYPIKVGNVIIMTTENPEDHDDVPVNGLTLDVFFPGLDIPEEFEFFDDLYPIVLRPENFFMFETIFNRRPNWWWTRALGNKFHVISTKERPIDFITQIGEVEIVYRGHSPISTRSYDISDYLTLGIDGFNIHFDIDQVTMKTAFKIAEKGAKIPIQYQLGIYNPLEFEGLLSIDQINDGIFKCSTEFR